MLASDLAPSTAHVRFATRATYLAFMASGFAFASWASRIPQVRDRLHLSPGELGLVLLALAAGAVIGLPLSGPVVSHWGSQRTVAVMAVLLGVGLAGTAVGYLIGVLPVLIGLFLLGMANGAWDVAMNVQGALVERHLGYSIMSRYHAGFSVGTVAGALVGAAMVARHAPVTAHLLVVAVAVGIAVPAGARSFIDDAAGISEEHQEQDQKRSALAAWREPRTLLIGIFVLAFAFAEGTGND